MACNCPLLGPTSSRAGGDADLRGRFRSGLPRAAAGILLGRDQRGHLTRAAASSIFGERSIAVRWPPSRRSQTSAAATPCPPLISSDPVIGPNGQLLHN